MKHVSCIALGLSSFVALAAIGCSGAADPVPTAAKKPSTAAGSTSTPGGSTHAPTANNSTSAGGTMPGTSTTLSDTSACGKKADATTCESCCVAAAPATALDAASQAEGDCMCAAAACQTACSASVCATTDNMNMPTDACFTCLDSHQAECAAKFDAACTSADCKAVVSCFTTQCDPLAKTAAGSSSGSSSGSAAQGATARSFSAKVISARAAAN